MVGRLILSIFSLSAVLVACGPDVDPIPPEMIPVFEEEVDLELVVRSDGNTMSFLDTSLEAPAGTKVRLVIDNVSTSAPAMVHNVVVLRSEEDEEAVVQLYRSTALSRPVTESVIVATPFAPPGTKAAVIFTMPAAGSYTYLCTYPGHHRGMRGVLVSTSGG